MNIQRGEGEAKAKEKLKKDQISLKILAYTLFFIRIYFIGIFMIKLAKKLRMSLEYGHLEILQPNPKRPILELFHL